MIHSKASTLQFHKVQGSKFFAKLSLSRQGSKALRLQEAKFGVPKLHDSKVPSFKHSKFPGSKIHGPRDPYCENSKFKVSGRAWRCPVQVPDLQRVECSRVLEFQGCRILRLQGSKVQRLHGYKPCRKSCRNLSESHNKIQQGIVVFFACHKRKTSPEIILT